MRRLARVTPYHHRPLRLNSARVAATLLPQRMAGLSLGPPLATDSGAKTTSIPHLERTAAEPRDKALIPVTLGKIEQVNDQIRLFRLEIPDELPPVNFLPGQWLDVYCPGVSKAGGFTLTSSPLRARRRISPSPQLGSSPGYLELAVQQSPDSPPAAWLWQNSAEILGQGLEVRIGGSFVWPPAGIDVGGLKKVVFVAGGVGINPLVSMLTHIAETDEEYPFEVEFLYSLKDPTPAAEQVVEGTRSADKLLFLDRIAAVFAQKKVKGNLRLFITGSRNASAGGAVMCKEAGSEIPFATRRVTIEDVAEALGDAASYASPGSPAAVVYVCGVPGMTDDFVERLTAKDGLAMPANAVLCEKWW